MAAEAPERSTAFLIKSKKAGRFPRDFPAGAAFSV
jgi:hypothetical protein